MQEERIFDPRKELIAKRIDELTLEEAEGILHALAESDKLRSLPSPCRYFAAEVSGRANRIRECAAGEARSPDFAGMTDREVQEWCGFAAYFHCCAPAGGDEALADKLIEVLLCFLAGLDV